MENNSNLQSLSSAELIELSGGYTAYEWGYMTGQAAWKAVGIGCLILMCL